ncbi:hypothetical protein Mapa_015675 [Marchantia paleacea]|nr:hypothetical protein Mapa_015675 [Marchantia paleacea]
MLQPTYVAFRAGRNRQADVVVSCKVRLLPGPRRSIRGRPEALLIVHGDGSESGLVVTIDLSSVQELNMSPSLFPPSRSIDRADQGTGRPNLVKKLTD